MAVIGDTLAGAKLLSALSPHPIAEPLTRVTSPPKLGLEGFYLGVGGVDSSRLLVALS